MMVSTSDHSQSLRDDFKQSDPRPMVHTTSSRQCRSSIHDAKDWEMTPLDTYLNAPMELPDAWAGNLNGDIANAESNQNALAVGYTWGGNNPILRTSLESKTPNEGHGIPRATFYPDTVSVSNSAATSRLAVEHVTCSAKSSRTFGDESPNELTTMKKEDVVGHLMIRLTNWLNSKFEGRARHNARGPSGPHTTSKRGRGLVQTEAGKQRAQKHPRTQSDDEVDDSDGENPQRKSQKPRKSGHNASPRYACPFCKHNPGKYQNAEWSSCCWPGWSTVHRVKEHLYRRHLLPKFQCSRCREVFESAGHLEAHGRKEIICDLKPREPQDGISQDQENSLRVRASNKKHLSEDQKWVDVYQILFPEDFPIPPPHVGISPFNPAGVDQVDNSFDQFEEYARNQFHGIMRPRLENMVEHILQQNISHEAVMDIAQEAFMRLFDDFRQVSSAGSGVNQNQTPVLPAGDERSAVPSNDGFSWFPELLTEQPGEPDLSFEELMDLFENDKQSDST